MVGNLVVGVVGAILGGWLFGALGLYPQSSLGSLITAVIGALVLLYIVGLIKKA